MKHQLQTPVYCKTDDKMKWPEDKFFYLLTQDGMFQCRNHPFFQSCVKMEKGPSELIEQKEFIKLSYPLIPRKLIELGVGFFQLVADKQNSEAAVVFAYNRNTKAVEMIVPDQDGINSSPSHWNPKGYPQDVKYKIPVIPPHLTLIGDMHSHVDGGAFASFTDEKDEKHRPGIHIIVGHIHEEPPEFFCEAVADGKRFKVEDMELVMEKYHQRNLKDVPPEWVEKVKLKEYKYDFGRTGGRHTVSSSTYHPDHGELGLDYHYGGNWELEQEAIKKKDRESVQKVLARLFKQKVPPSVEEVRRELFLRTDRMTYMECEKRAKQFVAAMEKGEKQYETGA